MPSWIETAEAALNGTSTDAEHELVTASPPPVLDAEGLRAVLSPFIAAFLWGAAIFREMQAATPLDPLALLLRLLALALTVRAILLLASLLKRAQLRLGYRRYGLALTPGGLLFRSPRLDIPVPREDILDIRERGRWGDRGGRRFADVYVVLHPRAGRTHVALPPVFERTPGMLAERLMRWLGPREESEERAGDVPPASDEGPLATELWERIARGERPDSVTVVPHGRAWLQRGPYASMLLGFAVLEGVLRLPESAHANIGTTMPMVLVALLVLVPIGWYLVTRRQIAPRRGLALILTPSELLFRMRSGVVRVPWQRLPRVEIQSRATWSLLQGAHEARWISLQRKNAGEIRYQESFLGTPLEVVSALCDAYRNGRVR